MCFSPTLHKVAFVLASLLSQVTFANTENATYGYIVHNQLNVESYVAGDSFDPYCGTASTLAVSAGFATAAFAILQNTNTCTSLVYNMFLAEVVGGCLCSFYQDSKCDQSSGNHTMVVASLDPNGATAQRKADPAWSILYYQCMRFKGKPSEPPMYTATISR
ncbi:unnamed protein product [Periconia digitata]|uniref:Uncharacterized protein n=1 Tax=Periconia digitata TaxID=1303443 RepID=A0A9W4U1S7_9PLEO|nr:unnamed protein product [Periconia digitata]